MARVVAFEAEPVAENRFLVIGDGLKERHHLFGIRHRVERLDWAAFRARVNLAAASIALVHILGILLLDVGRVHEHLAAQVDRRRRRVDRTFVAGFRE